jgi:putative salt-induced outer membrane protein YdiY
MAGVCPAGPDFIHLFKEYPSPMRIQLPSRILLSVFAAALLVLVAPALLRADTVVLKNGDHLTGTAVKLDGGKLTFKTAYADAIVIAWDQVTNLTTAQPLILPTAKGKLNVTVVDRSDAGLVLTTATGPITLPATEVTILRSAADQQAYEASLNPGWAHAWTGAANVSLALARGNSETTTFGAGFTAARPTRNDKTSLYANTLYSTNANSTPTTSANASGGGARYDHNVSPRLFVFGSGDFYADALQDLTLRSILGGGFGWHASKTPKQTFDISGGLVWTHESYSTVAATPTTPATPATVNSFPALDFGEQYTRKLGAGSLFTEQASIYPDLSNLSQYQFTLNTTFSTKLAKVFNWTTTFSDNYTSFPPAGTLDNDLVLTTGLGITLTRK